MPEIQTPEWVKDAVFYQIVPDRFAKSDAVPMASSLQPWGAPPTPHGYLGGDLLGMAEHLDYLADLGINAIYFTRSSIYYGTEIGLNGGHNPDCCCAFPWDKVQCLRPAVGR